MEIQFGADCLDFGVLHELFGLVWVVYRPVKFIINRELGEQKKPYKIHKTKNWLQQITTIQWTENEVKGGKNATKIKRNSFHGKNRKLLNTNGTGWLISGPKQILKNET